MLSKLVTPESIAVIGASASSEKIGYQILANLVTNKFKGSIYPVNPKGGEILGLPTFTSIREITSSVDMAVICIPSGYVASALRECAEVGVKSVIVITAGFSETGAAGEELQKEITEICQKSGMTMLGPNCLGLINTDINLNASFANGMPSSGNVSFLSQSGAMITAILDWSKDSGVGFSKIFSVGNKAMLGEAEILEYLYNDDSTDVILSYFENFKVSPELTDILIKYSKIKPTVVLFGGKSDAGAKAAASHTGSLVSSYLAVETYLKQAGVIVADTLEDLFIYSTVFSKYRTVQGDRIAIVTNAGGPSIAASDSIAQNGLSLAIIGDETKTKLREALRPEAPINNPIDVLGDASDLEYKKAIDIALLDDKIDGLLILLTPQSSTKINETAKIIAELATEKPVISGFIGGSSLIEAKKTIRDGDKICFDYPENGIKAMKALYDFSRSKVQIEKKVSYDRVFDLANKDALLKEFSLPILEYIEVNNHSELVLAGSDLGYPLVLKTASKEISHKSDAGGVKLNLKDETELVEAFSEIGSPAIVGKMIKGKHEIFLGIKKDENIGTVIAFGTGGIYSEVYKDLSYRVAPITKETAKEMVLETKMGNILSGARGQKVYNLDSIADIIVNTALFADSFSNIRELDFNPMIADEENFYLVDARIIES